MILVLPILPEFTNRNGTWRQIYSVLNIEICALAEMILTCFDDRSTFICTVIDLLYSDLKNTVSADNDLTLYNEDRLQALLHSSTFELFLSMFYESHHDLYKAILGISPNEMQWELIYEPTVRNNKLIIDVQRYV